MTEKQYGGSTGRETKTIVGKIGKNNINIKENAKEDEIENTFSVKDIRDYKKAGEIARKTIEYGKSFVKSGVRLLDIAEKLESKIRELGGKPAFPVNLSINEIAAHYTPSFDDSSVASGLLKIDLGVHVNGCIADTAISLDLENSEENKKLIFASEKALEKALEAAKKRNISQIGMEIHKVITSSGFSPVRNLSGHQLGKYVIHAGITIPNYDNGNEKNLVDGAYAIEPFATPGTGLVYDSKPSGIYRIEKVAGIRDALARKIIEFILEEYSTLPFCSRWIIKNFGPRAKLSLALLEQQGILHQYPQLVEKNKEKVSQAEHSFILTDKLEIITK